MPSRGPGSGARYVRGQDIHHGPLSMLEATVPQVRSARKYCSDDCFGYVLSNSHPIVLKPHMSWIDVAGRKHIFIAYQRRGYDPGRVLVTAHIDNGSYKIHSKYLKFVTGVVLLLRQRVASRHASDAAHITSAMRTHFIYFSTLEPFVVGCGLKAFRGTCKYTWRERL